MKYAAIIDYFPENSLKDEGFEGDPERDSQKPSKRRLVNAKFWPKNRNIFYFRFPSWVKISCWRCDVAKAALAKPVRDRLRDQSRLKGTLKFE